MGRKGVMDLIWIMSKMNRLIGLRVLEFPTGRPRPVLTTVYILILLFLSGGFVNFKIMELHRPFVPVERVLYEFMAYANIIVVISVIAFGIYYSPKVASYRLQMQKINQTLDKLGVPTDCHKIFVHVVIMICLLFFELMLQSILYYSFWMIHINFIVAIYFTFNMFYGDILGGTIFIDFIACIRWLHLTFLRMNELLYNSSFPMNETDDEQTEKWENPEFSLAELTHNFHPNFLTRLNAWEPANENLDRGDLLISRSPRVGKGLSKNQKKKYLLRSVRQVHLELCRITNLIYKIFHVQISMEFTLSLLVITATLYYMFDAIINPAMRINSDALIWMTIINTIAYCVRLFMLNHVCELYGREVNRTSEVIHARYHSGVDQEMREEVAQFSMQIAYTRIPMTANGFYRFSYTFLTSCIGSVTTYLVIMLQMTASERQCAPQVINRNWTLVSV